MDTDQRAANQSPLAKPDLLSASGHRVLLKNRHNLLSLVLLTLVFYARVAKSSAAGHPWVVTDRDHMVFKGQNPCYSAPSVKLFTQCMSKMVLNYTNKNWFQYG